MHHLLQNKLALSRFVLISAPTSSLTLLTKENEVIQLSED